MLALFARRPPPSDGPPRQPRATAPSEPNNAQLPHSDEQLIKAVRADDTSAFATIWYRHYAPMVAFATPYVGDLELAHDLVSDIFLRIWQTRNTWDVRTSIATYLYQSLRHRAANARRDAQVEATHVARAVAEESAIGASAPILPPDEASVHRDRAERLWRAVDALAEPKRTILRLRWREQMNFEEIAAVVGISPAAVQMQLSRALKMLRNILES